MFRHCSLKKFIILLILSLQVCMIILYLLLLEKNTSIYDGSNNSNSSRYNALAQSGIFLKNVSTRDFYIDFNSSLCYYNGTDIKQMQRNKILWKCMCYPNYHGSDCGQPEVIWRALLAYKSPLVLTNRKYERKIIYIFEVSKISLTLMNIRINELNELIDMFVMYEVNNNNNVKSIVTKGYLKQYQHKILYLQTDLEGTHTLWDKCFSKLLNIQSDDLVLYTDIHEVPNSNALRYLKLYNIQFPEPIMLRYKWSVYGFFWIHPRKTKLSSAIVTVDYLQNSLGGNLTLFKKQRGNFIIGDLNHIGGWYCEFCDDSLNIVEELGIYFNQSSENKKLLLNCLENLKKSNKVQVIDVNIIEDFIENGIYIDGKTELVRTHRSRDMYFAPNYLQEHIWEYEHLMINMYTKIDYD